MSAVVSVLVVVAAWAGLGRRGAVSARHDAAVVAPHVRTAAPARLRVEDEDGGPVVGAIVWAAGDAAEGVQPESRAQLATSDTDGIAALVIIAPQTAISITAVGYLTRAVRVGPRADMRVVLQRAHELEIVCEDLAHRPLPGVFVAIAPEAIPSDWLQGVVRRGAVSVRRDDEPYVAIADAAGVARFAAVPRGTVRWQMHAGEHALVEGPGITDAEPVTSPGRYRFGFAPLMASGFVVHGDRVVEVARREMPSADLPPVDRGGAASRAKVELQARFPDTHFFEVAFEGTAARETADRGEFVVDVLLEASGPRAVTLRWASLADYRARGPLVVSADAPPAPHEPFGSGQVVVRLRNPDGHEFVGRRLVLQAAGGRLLSLSTGSPTSLPVGVHRVVEPQDESILGRLPRPLRVNVAATGTEVTWTLQEPLRLVRFVFPDGLQEGAILVVYDVKGRWVGKAGRRGDETVDLLLPETPLWASFRAGSRSGAAVSFVPAPPSDPTEPCMTVRWKD